MKAKSLSITIGKGSVSHNTRSFIANNVDANRTKDNITFIHQDIKQPIIIYSMKLLKIIIPFKNEKIESSKTTMKKFVVVSKRKHSMRSLFK